MRELTLTFTNLRDAVPEHDRSIILYHLRGSDWYISPSLEQKYATVRWEWASTDGASQDYYCPIKDKGIPAGTVRDDGLVLAVYFCFGGSNGNAYVYPHLDEEDCENDWGVFEMAWQYTHLINREIQGHVKHNDTYFPSFDMWELLKEGTGDIVVDYVIGKYLVGGNSPYSSGEYYQVSLLCTYNGNKFIVDASQNATWDDDAWVMSGKMFNTAVDKIAEIDVFRVKCLEEE